MPAQSPVILFCVEPLLHKKETGKLLVCVTLAIANPSHELGDELFDIKREKDKSQ